MTDDRGRKEKAQKAADKPKDTTSAKTKRSTAQRTAQAKGRRSPKGSDRAQKPAKVPERTRVRASAKYVRCAPRKARLVIAGILGLGVDEARSVLAHNPRRASRHVLKLLESAVANAEANHELFADDLAVERANVDEGPTLKRYRPRALGRATRIDKRTSHMTITLSTKE